jgi:hypothetical protein
MTYENVNKAEPRSSTEISSVELQLESNNEKWVGYGLSNSGGVED